MKRATTSDLGIRHLEHAKPLILLGRGLKIP